MATDGIGSPDTPGYVDLAMYDVDEQDLVDRALTDATLKLTDWTPREGNTEVVLVESLALLVAELVYAINRTAAQAFEGVLGLYGLTRDAGATTTGAVQFTLADTFHHTIPAGTTVRATVPSTGETVDFTTASDLEILAGAGSGTVAITATETGTAGNGLTVGTVLELVDAVAYVESVTVSTATSGGRDEESDDAFYDRGSALLSRLVSTLVLTSQFEAAALENPAVFRAKGIDLYDGVGTPDGTEGGHVTVAVADATGAALSAAVKTALDNDLTARAIAGLQVHVIDPTITAVDVTVTVVSDGTKTAADVQASVTAALNAYLDPASWDWGAKVYVNELISIIDQAAGVRRVQTLTAPAADVTLAGAAPLADAGAITVTVV